MKKIISALVISLTVMSAQATPRPNFTMHKQNNYTMGFNNGYNRGYNSGKRHAYNEVAKNAFYIGTAVVAGIIIYQYGKNSNWTVSERGLGYRF